MKKYIAKEHSWFKTGTECELIDFLYDVPYMKWKDGRIQKEDKSGLFRGIRVIENPESEGGGEIGQEREDEEVCAYSEFDIVEIAEREK